MTDDDKVLGNLGRNTTAADQRATRALVLDDMMAEREALLIRLGQVEDTLIAHGRLNRRTKQPSRKR